MSERRKVAILAGVLLIAILGLWQLASVPERGPAERPKAPETDVLPLEPPPPAPEPGAGEAGASAEPASPTAARETAGKTAAPPASPGRVEGRVILAGGGDPGGVRVTLSGPPPATREIGLDPDGRFAVEGLSPGRYEIRALHPSLAARDRRFSIPRSPDAGPIEIVFRAGGGLRVTVLDAAEQPMEGQPIRASGPTSRRLTTGPDGRGELPRLPVGSYRVTWRAMVRKVAVVAGETTEVVFREAARLRGTLTGPDGEAPERFLVRLTPVRYGPEGYRAHSGYGNSTGRFDVRGIQPGEYFIKVQVLKPRSYVTGCGRITLHPGEEAVRDLRVRPTVISGRITRRIDGQPVTRRQVQVSACRVRLEDGKVVEYIANETAMTWVDEDGRYAFLGIEPGAWEIWIAPHVKDLNEARRVVVVPEGGRVEGTDFELTTKRLGTLRLTILGEEGKPVVGGVSFCRVDVREGRKWWTTLRAQGVVDGAYEFELEKGERRIAVFRRGYRTEPEEIVARIGEGRPVELTCRLIRQGAVLVTVLDAAGNPVEGARFALRKGDGKPREVERSYLKSGVYELWLDPGKATILVTKGGVSADPLEVEVKGGESVSADVRLGH